MRGAAFLVRSLCLASLVGCARNAAPAAQPVHDLAVRGGRILDLRRGSFGEPSVILISGTRVARIVDARRFDTASARRVIDANGLTILPGLIDAHVHLAVGGTVRDNARADLRAGFTTVADLGALSHRSLRLRDSINAGEIEGPCVLAAGIWVGAKDGVCEFTGIGIAARRRPRWMRGSMVSRTPRMWMHRSRRPARSGSATASASSRRACRPTWSGSPGIRLAALR